MCLASMSCPGSYSLLLLWDIMIMFLECTKKNEIELNSCRKIGTVTFCDAQKRNLKFIMYSHARVGFCGGKIDACVRGGCHRLVSTHVRCLSKHIFQSILSRISLDQSLINSMYKTRSEAKCCSYIRFHKRYSI